MATWDDSKGVLSFDQNSELDLVFNLLDVLVEIDRRVSLGQSVTCQAIVRQARQLVIQELLK